MYAFLHVLWQNVHIIVHILTVAKHVSPFPQTPLVFPAAIERSVRYLTFVSSVQKGKKQVFFLLHVYTMQHVYTILVNVLRCYSPYTLDKIEIWH